MYEEYERTLASRTSEGKVLKESAVQASVTINSPSCRGKFVQATRHNLLSFVRIAVVNPCLGLWQRAPFVDSGWIRRCDAYRATI